MRTKRVSIFIHALGPGGAERNFINLALSLREQGMDVSAFVLRKRGSNLEAIAQQKNLPIHNFDTSLLRGLPKLLYYFFKTRNDDQIFFNYFIACLAIFMKIVSRGKGKKIVRLINTTSKIIAYEKNLPLRYSMRFVLRFVVPQADHIISQSQGMKDDYISFSGIAPRKLKVIYNPCPEVTLTHDTNREAHTLLYVGRLTLNKGLGYLLDSFRIIVDKNPHTKLIIVGDGPERKSLEESIKKLNLSKNVTLEGLQKDISKYYLKARLTILTSLYEGFPNVLLESIAHGTPVVAFDCPSGPREIIIDGVNGFLAEYLNSKDVAAKVLDILSSKEFNTDHVKETSRKFSKAVMTQEYLEILG